VLLGLRAVEQESATRSRRSRSWRWHAQLQILQPACSWRRRSVAGAEGGGSRGSSSTLPARSRRTSGGALEHGALRAGRFPPPTSAAIARCSGGAPFTSSSGSPLLTACRRRVVAGEGGPGWGPRGLRASAGRPPRAVGRYLLTTTSTAPRRLPPAARRARAATHVAPQRELGHQEDALGVVSAARVASSGAEVVSMSTTWWVVRGASGRRAFCSLVSASGPSPGSGTVRRSAPDRAVAGSSCLQEDGVEPLGWRCRVACSPGSGSRRAPGRRSGGRGPGAPCGVRRLSAMPRLATRVSRRGRLGAVRHPDLGVM